jgi:thiamine-phosphate pyrophosphorylase
MRRSPLTVAGVYAILDLPHPSPLAPEEIAAALMTGGARMLQLRAKRASPQQRRAWAVALAEPCAAAGVPLIINDDLELAESGVPGISGVHLGQSDLGSLGSDLHSRQRRRERLRACGLALGVSTHDLAQLHEIARVLAPDYVGFGPVFATASKRDPEPTVGLDELARACGESPVPVVAIGGIDSARALQVATTGAAAIAAIGALHGETVESIRERTAALVRGFAG